MSRSPSITGTATALSEPPTDVDAEREFTCFPTLPIELRHNIWKHISYIPRNIDIWSPYRADFELEGKNFQCNHYSTIIRPPPILHTSHEARSIALRHYELAFETEHKTKYGFSISTPPRIYVNWDVDIVCPMGLHNFTKQTLSGITHHPDIRHVAFNAAERTFTKEHLMTQLKTITLYRCPSFDHDRLPEYYRGFDIAFDPSAFDAESSEYQRLCGDKRKLAEIYRKSELLRAQRGNAVVGGPVKKWSTAGYDGVGERLAYLRAHTTKISISFMEVNGQNV